MSILKVIFRLLIAGFVALLLLIALLPTLISSSWGKDKLLSFVNAAIPGKFEVKSIAAGWSGPQSVEGVILKDAKGAIVFTLDKASVHSSLFDLLLNPSTPGTIDFGAFNAKLISDNQGNTNLMYALNKKCCPPEIKEGETPVIVIVKNVHGVVNLDAHDAPLTVKINGETLRGNLQGKFVVDAELRGLTSEQLIHADKDLAELIRSTPGADLKVNADVANFPVVLIDEIVALSSPKYSGLLSEAMGDQINLTVKQQSSSTGITLALRGDSPNLKAAADVIVGKELTLSKPATINLKVTPDLVDKMMEIGGKKGVVKLSDATTANIVLSKLELPLSAMTGSFDDLDLNLISLAAALDVGQATLVRQAQNITLALKGAQATLALEANEPTAAISVKAEAVNNQQPTKINLNMTVPKEVLLEDLSHFSLRGIIAEGQITGAPLSLLDDLSSSAGIIAEALGATADLSFSLHEREGKALAAVQFKSDRLEIPDLAFWIDDKITLKERTAIVIKLPPSLLNLALKDVSPRVQNTITAQLAINAFSLPVSALKTAVISPISAFYKADLESLLTLSSAQIIGLPTLGNASLSDFSLQLSATPHKHPEFAISLNIQPEGAGKLYDLIGKKVTFSANASLGISISGKPNLSVFSVQAFSELGRVEFSGQMLDGDSLVLNTPAIIRYTLTSAGLQTMGISSEKYLFTHGSPLEVTLDTSHLPIKSGDLSKLRLNGTVHIADLQVTNRSQKGFPQAILDNLVAKWSVDAVEKIINVDFTGITRLGQQEAAGKLNGSLVIDKWIKDGLPDFQQAVVSLNTQASNLPTQLISGFSGQSDIISIIGNALDVEMSAKVSMDMLSKGTMALDLNSENLTGTIALALGEVVHLDGDEPAEFKLKLTPKTYILLRDQLNSRATQSDFTLAETATATLKLKSLSFPIGQPLVQAGLEGDFSLDHIEGIDTKTNQRLALHEIKGQVASQNIAEHVSFDMQAKGQGAQGIPTAWNFVGAIDNGFVVDGSVNHQDLSMHLDATIESLPIPLLCQFVCVDPKIRQKLEALIGPTLDAKIKARLQRMNGPLYVELNGKNGHLTIDAKLSEGYLLLNQNLVAQVSVTPQLSKHVFSDLIPVISGMLSADHPIKLTIDREGFYLPVNEPSAKTVSIPQATLEIGKVRFSGQSQLAKVLSLLTPANNDEFMVWSTPTYFSLTQGILKLERVDMLISDYYPIAAWGNVDLNKERVNMIIALSGAAIDKAFGVSGIPNSYLLQIPLRGKLDSPSIDKAKAAGRLSALVAQTKGGPQGVVIGTVLDIASGGLTEGAPPEPTTKPLPWADLMKDQPSEKKSLEQQVTTPIEETIKGASSILKKLFK